MAKLKPCPFCGREVGVMYSSISDTYNFYHKYLACEALEPIKFDGEHIKSIEQAVAVWNRRADNA